MPVLDDGVGGIDDGAVEVEEDTGKGMDLSGAGILKRLRGHLVGEEVQGLEQANRS